ncbi:GNAT family N-acetyltransferase [Rhodopseudomonas palustris]|uniref:GNAT family N-acetyltransferase n=1 Tax=Rhodopseudomonas palustris TaxID=1076 RepID=UPI00064197F2|nr:GNAT family N-acetyltransferase [Rhodopseudomonas palustris]
MTATVSNWRSMTVADLPVVNAIAAAVHVDYPEDPAVFAERLTLHPGGCFVLDTPEGVGGYLISHPWHLEQPPALNELLGSVPSPAPTYYLHDIALLPAARGGGATAAILATMAEHAATIADTISLVAVGGTARFWQRFGFEPIKSEALARKLTTYGGEARYMLGPAEAIRTASANHGQQRRSQSVYRRD